jgi:hypothetical protein
VKYFAWDDAKNAKLRTDRGIGFEDIVFDIERGDLLDILKHPSLGRCGQRIFVVRREDYVYLVPFVEDAHTVFLKTIIRAQISRRSRRPGLEASLLFEQMSTCARQSKCSRRPSTLTSRPGGGKGPRSRAVATVLYTPPAAASRQRAPKTLTRIQPVQRSQRLFRRSCFGSTGSEAKDVIATPIPINDVP